MACKTTIIDTLDGFEYGRTKVHSHGLITFGEIIRMEAQIAMDDTFRGK